MIGVLTFLLEVSGAAPSISDSYPPAARPCRVPFLCPRAQPISCLGSRRCRAGSVGASCNAACAAGCLLRSILTKRRFVHRHGAARGEELRPPGAAKDHPISPSSVTTDPTRFGEFRQKLVRLFPLTSRVLDSIISVKEEKRR